MSQATDAFVSTHSERFLAELKAFLRIPSISTSPEHAGDVRAAAQFVADQLTAAGLEHVEVIATERHPLVYADWLHAPGKPTVLCYGHYDVQPPDPLEEWISPPFEPTIRDGRIWARGATDNKGQMLAHVLGIGETLAAQGGLPVNLILNLFIRFKFAY